MKILELFSGIGAVSTAVHGTHEVVCSVDINQLAMQVFEANFSSPTWVQEISSITNRQFSDFAADLWWLSPPCQPYTRRGLKKDIDDPRSAALLRIIDAIEEVRPDHIALENVRGFENSQSYHRLITTLTRNGYEYCELPLCLSELGVPNIRPRYFLVASKQLTPRLTPPAFDEPTRQVLDFLDPEEARTEDLAVDESDLERYYVAVNIVDAQDTSTRCFTSAYGRSNVFSGSYLRTEEGFRRFSPREIARFLGFPDHFVLPKHLSTQQLWKLLGNAVSVPCVKYVLAGLTD